MSRPPGDPEREAEDDADLASGGDPHRQLSRSEVIAIIGGLALAMFLAALNQTIVATALPTIGRAFGDFENLSWIVLAYLITSTAVAPLYGKLSDIYGRRVMMLVAIGIFMAGSAACAMAPSMLTLILGRAAQGIGGGGIVPLAQSIIADAVPPRERGHYQAYTGSVWIIAGGGGPVLGGFIAEHLHWSMIFWINVPLALAAAFLSNWQLKRLPKHGRRRKLDLVGAALMMVASIALMLALTWGGTRFSWLSAEIAGLFVASALLSVVFVWWVMRVPDPFLPISVLNNPVMRIGVVASSCTQGVSIGLTIYVPMYYELVHKLSASDSGLALIPIVMMTTPGSFMSGRAMLYLRHYKWVPIAMLVMTTIAVSFLAIFPFMPVWAVAVVMCFVGLGTGSSYPVVTVSIQNALPHHQIGVAMGAMNFFRALASALVVAVMGAIMLAHLGTAPQRGVSNAASSTLAAVATASPAELARTFSTIFAVAAFFLVLSIVALVIMEERPLRTYVVAPPVVPAQPDKPDKPAEAAE